MGHLHEAVGAMAAAVLIAGLGDAGAVAAGWPAEAPAIPTTGNTIPDPSAWQHVITGQIEAFRRGDAKAAMSYAGTMFRRRFTDPTTFMMSVAAAGYIPIFTSQSHTFGKFTQPDPKTAVQVVELVGPRQELYEAIYALSKEADGWRIEGVQLMRIEGLAA